MNLRERFSLRIDLSFRGISSRGNAQPRERLIFNPVEGCIIYGSGRFPFSFGDYSYIKEFIHCVASHIPGRCIGRRMRHSVLGWNRAEKNTDTLIVAFMAGRRMAMNLGQAGAVNLERVKRYVAIQCGTRCPNSSFSSLRFNIRAQQLDLSLETWLQCKIFQKKRRTFFFYRRSNL